MNKLRILFIISMILFTAFYVDIEVSNYRKNQKLSIELDSIKTLAFGEAFVDDGLYIAQGKISTRTPLQVYDLKTDSSHFNAFLLNLKVEIFQLVETYKTSNNRKASYEYNYSFVEAIPPIFKDKDVKNPNFEQWPISYQSTLKMSDHYFFKDSILLDATALKKEMVALKDKIASYYHIDFEPPHLMNKKIHKKYNGNYFYGNDPKQPEIGDIRIKLSGFKTSDTSSFSDYYRFTLMGNYQLEHGFMPFYNQKTNKERYYFWSYMPTSDDFAKAKKEVNQRVKGSQRL